MENSNSEYTVRGRIVDVFRRRVYGGYVRVRDGKIVATGEDATAPRDRYILPGWVDAHVHIESSMLTPSRFGAIAVRHGVVGVVTDPHEIANVCGVSGIEYMLSDAKASATKCFFTVPSCVPSCAYDENGGTVTSEDVERLMSSGRFYGLSEVMNAVGVVSGDEEVMRKIASAKKYGLAVDGHSPGLTGDVLRKYAEAGIQTDHECTTLREAEERIGLGMKILIREGSAACNYEALSGLIGKYPGEVMLCTDDISVDKIETEGYMDRLVSRAVKDGYDLYDVIRAATVNAVEHYHLPVGLLREGDRADFQVVEDLKTFRPSAVYVDGIRRDMTPSAPEETATLRELPENFMHDRIDERELEKAVDGAITIMEVTDRQIVTKARRYAPGSAMRNLESDAEQDVVKLVYVNRYRNGKPQVAWIRGTGIREGAFATSVNHDTHNLIAFGSSDRDIASALNAVIEKKGGRAFAARGEVTVLGLPVGGLMSTSGAEELNEQCQEIRRHFSRYPLTLTAPFMTLSFLGLLVTPEIKIGEKGLFSFSKWDWVEQ